MITTKSTKTQKPRKKILYKGIFVGFVFSCVSWFDRR